VPGSARNFQQEFVADGIAAGGTQPIFSLQRIKKIKMAAQSA